MKMCEALAEAGHEVTLFGRRGQTDSCADIFAHYGTGATFRLQLVETSYRRGIRGVERLVRSLRAARHLPAPDLWYGRDALLLLLCVGAIAAPVVYESHQFPDGLRKRLIEGRLFGHPQFARLVTISHALANAYEADASFRPRDIMVAPVGADVVREVPGESPLSDHTNRPKVGYVGSLYRGRGVEMLMAIAAELPSVSFHVVGGSARDLDELRRTTTVPANVTLYGHIRHASVPSYIAHCDVMVAPYQERIEIGSGADTSRWASPMKILEYMGQAKPIVCSDLPVLRELLRDRDSAMLVAPGDVKAWKAKIAEVVADPGLARRLGEHARVDIETRHSWSLRAKRVVDGLQPAREAPSKS